MSKTAKKKIAKKPRVFRSVDEVKKAYFPKKYAEDMKALNDKIDLLDSRLRTLNAWETMQDAMEEARSAPAEKWKPKANEVMGCVNNSFAYICDSVNEDGWSIEVSNSGGSLGQKSYKIFRKATGAEMTYQQCVDIVSERIASHKAKEEQRVRDDERAKEMAKKLEFGTRVKWDTWTGRVACEGPDHENQYLVAYKPGNGSVWHSTWVLRRDLTIID